MAEAAALLEFIGFNGIQSGLASSNKTALPILKVVRPFGMGVRDGAHGRNILITRHPGDLLAILAEFDLQSFNVSPQQAIFLIGHV